MLKKIILFTVFIVFTTTVVYAAPADVPKSGQTTKAATGDDGDLQRGVAWPNPRFTDNGNGTVTDNLTGLIWLKDANCTFGGSVNYRTWDQALTAANGLADGQCGLADGSAAGDWRLPNVNELESLVHAEYTNTTLCVGGCSSNAAWLNTQGFSNVQADDYWSSTTYAGSTAFAWGVYMVGGVVGAYDKTLNYFVCVWPVRSGQ